MDTNICQADSTCYQLVLIAIICHMDIDQGLFRTVRVDLSSHIAVTTVVLHDHTEHLQGSVRGHHPLPAGQQLEDSTERVLSHVDVETWLMEASIRSHNPVTNTGDDISSLPLVDMVAVKADTKNATPGMAFSFSSKYSLCLAMLAHTASSLLSLALQISRNE